MSLIVAELLLPWDNLAFSNNPNKEHLLIYVDYNFMVLTWKPIERFYIYEWNTIYDWKQLLITLYVMVFLTFKHDSKSIVYQVSKDNESAQYNATWKFSPKFSSIWPTCLWLDFLTI